MRKLIFTAMLLLVPATAFADISKTGIRFDTVQPAGSLQTLLRDLVDDINGEFGVVKERGTGNVYYVDSGAGSNTYTGTKPEWAKATLDAAVALCTANNGDVIYVMQGHNEALTAADGVDLDVAGITVIGLGEGSDRPRFDFDHADGEFVIGAASVLIRNLTFLPSVNIVTHAIDIENAGDWAIIEFCEFLEGETGGTDEFVDCIQVGTTATNGTIRYNVYTCISGAAAPNNFVDLSAATISAPSVYGNVVKGNFAEAGIWGSNAVPTDVYIVGNAIWNNTASQFCIELQGNATGVIANNLCYATTEDFEVDPGTCFAYNNNEGKSFAEGSSVVDALGTDGATLYDVATSIAGIIGIPSDADNAVDSTTIVANRDGSLYERLEHVLDALVDDETTNLVGFNDADNAADTTTVAANRDGSLLERLEHLLDALVDDETSNLVGVNDADNAADTSTVAANADGSLLERAEAIQTNLGPYYRHPNYLTVDVNLANATWQTAAAHEVLTVTGACRVQILIEVTETCVTTGPTGTMALGYEGNASAIFSATGLDSGGTTFTAGDVVSAVYGSAATTPASGANTSTGITGALFDVVVVGGKDIGYTIATNAATDGTLVFHVWWQPLDATGAVAAGAGGVL